MNWYKTANFKISYLEPNAGEEGSPLDLENKRREMNPTPEIKQEDSLQLRNNAIKAGEQRFAIIRKNLIPKKREEGWDYMYSGRAENPNYVADKAIGEMLANSIPISEDIAGRILKGEFDKYIEAGWHLAAGSEWWYRSGEGKEY